MYDHTFSKIANHQIRHQATYKVGCQPGDCIWSFQFSSGVCAGIYGIIYPLYHHLVLITMHIFLKDEPQLTARYLLQHRVVYIFRTTEIHDVTSYMQLEIYMKLHLTNEMELLCATEFLYMMMVTDMSI